MPSLALDTKPCGARTKAGKPCRAPASEDGYCGAHGSNYRPPGRRTKLERKHLTEQARAMRAEGHTYEVIGPALGISPFTAAIYAPGGQSSRCLPNKYADRRRVRKALAHQIRVDREQREALESERSRQQALQELERRKCDGSLPSWYPASERMPTLAPSAASQAEIDALIADQSKDDRFAKSSSKRRFGWLASLDAPLTTRDGSGSLHDVISAEGDGLASLMEERP